MRNKQFKGLLAGAEELTEENKKKQPQIKGEGALRKRSVAESKKFEVKLFVLFVLRMLMYTSEAV